jgi:replication factor A1
LKQKKSSGEYLAFLTVKYDVHPDLLFCALLAAGEMGKAKCGALSIEHRGKLDGKNYFLIKEGTQFVSQFPVSEEFLLNRHNPVRDFMETDMVQNYKPKDGEESGYSEIEDLKMGQKHINLKAEVVDVSKPKIVNGRLGNRIRLAKALLKDETGEIKLCLWKGMVGAVSKGDHVEIRDATVTKFMENTQLTLGSKGQLNVVENIVAKLS